MRALRFWALVALAVSWPSAVLGQAAAPAPELRLRAGDALRIEIRDEPLLSGEFPIGTNGSVLLPTLGSRQVANQLFSDVERSLRESYSRELVNADIRITPLLRIAVLGEVRQPGLFLVDPTFSAADILARAGGLTPNAREKDISIRRPTGEVTARFDIANSGQPILLTSGDQIFVQRKGWAAANLGIFLSAAGSVAVALITAALVR
jgi:polysaccharide biosynthesis/export protein